MQRETTSEVENESTAKNPFAPTIVDENVSSQSILLRDNKLHYFPWLIFAVVRAVSAGFAALLAHVYSIGLTIKWHNVLPMAAVAVVACVTIHWIEWKLDLPRQQTFLRSLQSYTFGIVVAAICIYLAINA